MHREPGLVPDETARAVGRALVEKRPVMAVGTTALRALESAALVEPGADRAHALRAGEGSTDLFIRPGYRFRVVDRLLTNFHLPRSTLIMLAAAFAGRRRLLEAYATAVEHSYRFYSYGDATLLDRAFFPSEPSSP
jgi:S-adenosylmethionine:tRNA ribosyltransferase-isomerase